MQRLWFVILALIPAWPVVADDPPGTPAQQIADPVGDTVIRRTDPGGAGSIGGPTEHHRPDIILINVGNWAPFAPATGVYDGAWAAGGQFVRIDVRFDGLINPPGPIGLDGFAFAPFAYGPHPVYGCIEIDMDSSVATGGETWAPGDRYLGNIARFGGKPATPRFADRVALSGYDLPPYNGFPSPPFVQRSGEEFHIAFLGEEIEAIVVADGNFNSTFEVGETWLVEGRLFHRAHGFEEFSFAPGPPPGAYEPRVELRWRYRLDLQCTEVTLVYPLTNEAWIAAHGTGDNVVINGDANDQNSVHEGLNELVFSAINAPAIQHSDPEWPIIADWAFQTAAMHLNTATWRLTALVGMSYAAQAAGGALYVWTDAVDGVVSGDVNGDGVANGLDAQLIAGYIQTCDGNSTIDADATVNGSVGIIDWARNFSVYDLDYDGAVTFADVYGIIIFGDMDLDLDVDMGDVPAFVNALLYQQSPSPAVEWSLYMKRGDFNSDGRLDGRDIAGFVNKVLGGSSGTGGG